METFKHIAKALAQAFDDHNIQREHDLIRRCQAETLSPFHELTLARSLDLFKAHFIVRHCLYQLQNSWRDQNAFELEIGMVEIKRQPYTAGAEGVEYFDYLREYYLDLDNLHNTTEAEVNLLLTGFWNYFNNVDQRANALRLLGLEADADYPTIKRKFRQLAQQMHPDKGGSEKDFQQIVEAKNILDALRGA